MKIFHYIRQQVDNWSTVFVRFPIVIVMVVLICGYCSFQYAIDKEINGNIMMPMLLFTGLTLISYFAVENLAWSKVRLYIMVGFALILSIIYHYTLEPQHQSDWAGIKFLTMLLIIHMIIAIIPTAVNKNQLAFLRYNMHLLETYVISAILSLILFLLLILAIYAIRILFDKPFNGDAGIHLFIWIAGFIHSLNFLSTFPRLPLDENALPVYNGRFYKVLVNFIGNPVIVIYAIIILAYGIKILFGGQYQPWITAMCGWYLILGTLAYLFNRLLLTDHPNTWSAFFNKAFIYFSIPVVLLFAYCVQRNITEEGFNQPNYYSLLLGVMAVIIMGLIGFKKDIHLRIVPMVFIIGATYSILPGPLNVHNLSVQQQKKRLEQLMLQYGCIKDGHFDFSKPMVQDDLYKLERSVYAMSDEELQFLKKYDIDKTFKSSITANDLLTKWRSPNAEVNLESKYFDYVPLYVPKAGEEIWPIVNQYINTPADYKGLKILPTGLIGIYNDGKLNDSIKVLPQGLLERKLTAQSMVEKVEYEIYINNLSYRHMDSLLHIVDLTGLCVKK